MVRVVVIGAGPAGIAVGAQLRAVGIEPRILERHETWANLRRIDPATRLLSPARLSRLPGMHELDGGDTYPTFATVIDAFERYRVRHGLDPEVETEVHAVREDGDELVVETSRGIRRADHVVDASGLISRPHVPASSERLEIPWKHSLDVRRDDLVGSRRLLVVGAGTSAAEVLENWLEVRSPDARAWMSVRSQLLAVPHRVAGLDVHYLAWLPEHLPARWPFDRLSHREPMIGRAVVHAIARGEITRVGGLRRCEAQTVVLADGSALEPDLVVFATGFRFEARHLGDLVPRRPDGTPVVRANRSPRVERLHVLGVRSARTLASQFLRGIGRDAVHVARQIASGGSRR